MGVLSRSLAVPLIARYSLPWSLIFNNDQGSQFTSEAFTDRLEASNIAISWNGRGSYFDNIFIERLWRSVKAVSNTRRFISTTMTQ